MPVAIRTRTCAIDDCGKAPVGRGWCEAHYRRARRHGDPLGGRHPRTGCLVTDCKNPHSCRGYCAVHYQRYVRHGDPAYVTFSEVDHAVVERALRGDWHGPMTIAEREAVIRRLHSRGLNDARIARHLDIGPSGVQMARNRLGLPANQRPGRGAA